MHGEGPISNRVDALMNPVQASSLDPSSDPAIVEPEPSELRAGNDAVLLRREVVDKAIELAASSPMGRFRSI